MERIYVGLVVEGHRGYYFNEDDLKKELVSIFNRVKTRKTMRLIGFGEIKLKVQTEA